MQKEWFTSWFDTPYYHLLYRNRDTNEASFFIDNITQFLNLQPNTVCWDLCCGKGRHSVYLNKKGFQVVGTDLSVQSIIEANKSANDSLQFYSHDMRTLFRTNYFNTVFNLFTSFGYFEKREDDLHVFRGIEKSLKPDGLFIFDFLNATYIQNNLVSSETKIIDGITFNISKETKNNTVIKNIDFTDQGIDYHYEERVKLFEKSYFEELAKECNLSVLHTFGNYKLDPFNINTSPRLILILKKEGTSTI